MNYKDQILKLLERLSEAGIGRHKIEQDFAYAENFIDQALSRGGNKKFLAALKIYEKAMLQNATPPKGREGGEPVSLETLQTDLDNILHHQVLTRAEVRAYGQYPISRDAKGNKVQVVRIMQEIGMLVAEHEANILKEGIRAGKRK